MTNAKKKPVDYLADPPDGLGILPAEWTPNIEEEITRYVRSHKKARSPEDELEIQKYVYPVQLEGFLEGRVTEPEAPGGWIKKAMPLFGWDAAFLSENLRLQPNEVAQLLANRQPITAPIAVNLQHISGISAESWLGVQAKYELNKLRKKS